MGWLARLVGRERVTARRIAEAGADPPRGRVVLEGIVEVAEPIHCPITGEPAVAIEYEARAPGFVARAYGLREQGSVRLASAIVQATDFVLSDGSGRALVRVEHGSDVGRIHSELTHRHGLELSASASLIRPGDRVRVHGRVRAQYGSPHRRDPHDLIVDAVEIEPVSVDAAAP